MDNSDQHGPEGATRAGRREWVGLAVLIASRALLGIAGATQAPNGWISSARPCSWSPS